METMKVVASRCARRHLLHRHAQLPLQRHRALWALSFVAKNSINFVQTTHLKLNLNLKFNFNHFNFDCAVKL